MKNGKTAAFRPAMSLATGELSGIGGKFIFMTATASKRTIRILMNELPELQKWDVILNSPMRDNVTMVIPHPDKVSSKFEVALTPFVDRINKLKEVYLIIVRGF